MNVIFTSKSAGKATASVRKVLDRYATRIGDDAWEASLTMEGLNTVKTLLNKASSGKTSVVCHRITQDGARVIAWVVGNRRAFTNAGACATGWTAKRKSPKEDSSLPYSVRLISRIVSIAGLLHDIGKANTAFQDIIHGRNGNFEEFRHEAVSAMMLGWLSGHDLDSKWISEFIAAIDSGTIDAKVRESLTKESGRHSEKLREPSGSRPAFAGAGQADCRNTPVLFSLLWLITAHHRLPSGESEEYTAIDASKHYRAMEQTASVDDLASEGLPWNHDRWLKRLREDLVSLTALLADPEFERGRTHLFDHLRLFGRPAFQLADHMISAEKEAAKTPSRRYAYANSTRTPEGAITVGQRLHTHLIKVSRQAAFTAQALMDFRREMYDSTAEEIPASLRKRSKDIRFTWQDKAAASIRSHRTGVHDGAFFGALIAGTGSGKTIGALKISAAFKNPLRVVYASPLRSLTLQSGSEFGSLGFTPDTLATIIGDPLIQKMYYADRSDAQEGRAGGRFVDTEFEDHMLNLDGGLCSADILERFREMSCLQNREQRMVATPVLVATLDTVMKLADGRRGSYLSHLLRIASSDLIIDEVDMFSPIDLLAIGRLIEAAGFWRSRVILSSATLSPVISTAFFTAFRKGLKSRDAIENSETKVFGGWFSDVSDPVIRNIESEAQFDRTHLDFAESVATTAAKKEKRRVAAFIHRKPNLDDPLDIGTLKKAIDLLHKNNSVILPGDRSFSFGCIQVVNVSHCQQITLKLTELAAQSKGNDDLDFRVICLHGRLSLAVRNWLDRQMNPMLCRKGPSGDLAPLSNPFVREFVAGSACRDTAIVLVSTMETTGRDHDFDWGIIESRQERDIIQFAGRIRRHRPPGDQVKNLIVWDAPLRWKGAPWKPRDPTDNPDAFQFFGVGDRIGKDLKQVVLRRTHQHPKYGLMPSYQEMLESTYGKAPLITPSRILTETSPPASDYDAKTGFASTVRACETARLRSTLLECRPHKCHTLAEWLTDHNKIHRLLCKHQDQYRFRSGRPMELYWRDEDGAWYYVVEPGRELESSVKQPEVPDISVANNGFLFSSLDEDVEIFEIQEKTSSFHRKDRIRLSGVYFTEPPSGDPTRLRYHPQIGLYAGSGR